MKDSGERTTYDSGMLREPSTGRPRFELLVPLGVEYKDQMLTRLAVLMAKGAEKYDERNWEQAEEVEELERMKEAAFRHFMQWLCGESDEDHAAALIFNVLAHESTVATMRYRDAIDLFDSCR